MRSVLVLVLGLAVGLSVVGARTPASGGTPAQGSGAAPLPKLVGSPSEIMLVITVPASDKIFDAAADPPKDDEGWSSLRLNAIAVAETSNLLVLPGRAPDQAPEWMAFSQDQLLAAVAVMRAAEAKDTEALTKASNALYDVCTKCHDQYMAGAK